MNTDQNLLFGVLALQLEYIDASQFADVCAAWAARKNLTVADIMVERGWITPQAKGEVEGLLTRKLDRHGGDARKALGDAADASARDVMRDVSDEQVDETLDHLEPPSGFVKVLETVDFSPEERSHYTLSRVHTQGGLGRVWLARDKRLHREVALKEIRPDKRVSQLSLRRFVREAQITGQLEHPNIVPVYELADTLEKERPFYTMRFLRGQSLGAAIDEYHRLRQVGKAGRFDLRRLLSAFVGVCHAIAYAHSKGVVHRDMKPANVMLGAFGEVVLLDWGLAKLLDQPDVQDEDASHIELTEVTDGEATREGQLVGTLPYMAPEQAKGQPEQIDARTDIYGLGATLFRILTGQRPHRGKGKEEICANIARQPTPRPRSVDPSIPKAMDAVCAKAMAEKRSDRYQSATELAIDVQRWMADEPVSVHPESWQEKFARWARKHRTIAVATAVTVFLVAIVASTASVLIEGARRDAEQARIDAEDAWRAEEIAKGRAVEAWREEERAREAAETAEGEARKARDTALTWFEHAVDSVDSMWVGVTDVLRWYPGTQRLRERLLGEAVKAYERFAAEDADDPQLRAQLGRIHVLRGDVLRQLGQAENAEQAYRQADAILDELKQTGADAIDVRLERTICQRKLGDACTDQGQYDEAKQAYNQANLLVDELSSQADRRYQLAHIFLSRGLLAEGTENFEQAERLLGDAEAELEGLLQTNEGDAQKCRHTLAIVKNELGQVYVLAGRDDEAIEPIEKAKDAYRALHDADADNPLHLEGLVAANINLANALRTSGRTDEEHVLLKRAIDDSTILLNSMPDVPQFWEYLAIAQTSLARVWHDEHANTKAKALLDDAIPVFTSLADSPFSLRRYRQQLAIAHTIRGQVLRDLDESKSADEDFREAIRNYLSLMNDEPNALAHVRGAAIASRQRGRLLHTDDPDTAKDEYASASAAFQNVLGQKPDDRLALDGLAACLEHLGDLLEDSNEPDEAKKCYQEALVHREQLPGYPAYEFRKAVLLLKIDHATEARAVAKALADANPENVTFSMILGAAQLRTKEAEECIRTLEGIDSAIRERACPELEFWLAMAYGERNEPGDSETAKQLFDQAVQRTTSQAPGCVALLRLRAEAAEKLGIGEAESTEEKETPEDNDETP
ncbi:MAG: protein kinase [Planctomycetes bacterium]|nr:protein kinase [Planctomycetota bacterium]MBL7041195.1 protein kinase [Pirellulaceae bacterium]